MPLLLQEILDLTATSSGWPTVQEIGQAAIRLRSHAGGSESSDGRMIPARVVEAIENSTPIAGCRRAAERRILSGDPQSSTGHGWLLEEA